MKKKLAVLGSTGSIGKQTLEIAKNHLDLIEVVLLACGSDTAALQSQIDEFRPKFAVVSKGDAVLNAPGTAVFYGEKYLSSPELLGECDIIVNALSGLCGLKPTLVSLELDKPVATANKESIVAGGALIGEALKRGGALYPIDSEHSAIWQCMCSGRFEEIEGLILTASGGAFRDLSLEELKYVKAKDALIHPNWKMGDKITIDCATMVNKGLEIFEAQNLFGIKNVSAVMHRESIVHALVEFCDGAVVAGLSNPDMRIPISLALFEGERLNFKGIKRLKLEELQSLTFSPVDLKRYPCFGLALEIKEKGGNGAAVYTFANDILVGEFLNGNIAYIDFAVYIRKALDKFFNARPPEYIDEIKDIERKVGEYTKRMVSENK